MVNGDSSGIISQGPAAALPTVETGDVEAARRRYEQAAASSGVSLDGLAIYEPDGIAIAATLKSHRPAFFLTHQMPRFLAALGDYWDRNDGAYIRLIDDTGATVWET